MELSIPGANGQRELLASQVFTFSNEREIQFGCYLLVGFCGIALGYLVRLVMKVEAKLPQPSPAPEKSEDVTGPVTSFVARNYYKVDFALTLLLGNLVLLALSHSYHPPSKAADVPGALIFGFSLGLLTNSDLITRLGQ